MMYSCAVSLQILPRSPRLKVEGQSLQQLEAGWKPKTMISRFALQQVEPEGPNSQIVVIEHGLNRDEFFLPSFQLSFLQCAEISANRWLQPLRSFLRVERLPQPACLLSFCQSVPHVSECTRADRIWSGTPKHPPEVPRRGEI
jgi:hypothetical protein